jgi:hypothetical protein
MNEDQRQALRTLSERANQHPENLAFVEGIPKNLIGELFRRGHISKPKKGYVSLKHGGAALARELRIRAEMDAAEEAFENDDE